MSVTIIGLIVMLLGLCAYARPPGTTIRIALFLTPFGSAAALALPALGGASILAGVLFTGVVLSRVLLLKNGLGRLGAALRPAQPGFWLMLAVGYGVFAAFLIAPFFHGRIMVVSIARSADAATMFVSAPLQRSSGNLTQSVYAIGQVLLFAAMAATIRSAGSRQIALDALVVLGALHVIIAVLDVLTFYSGTAFLIDWMRSAGYITWQSASIAGLKRISGLYPEASTWAIYGMAVTGILLSLRLSRYRPRLTGPLFLASLILLILSTSTTAYAALALSAPLLAGAALIRMAQGKAGLLRMMAGLALVGGLAGLALLLLWPDLFDGFLRMLDDTVFNKIGTDSAQDRGNLNRLAFAAFLDSHMLGLGLGSARTSSFVLTLLSNLGLPGTLAWVIFFYRCAIRPAPLQRRGCRVPTRNDAILRRAAQSGMIGGLIGATISLSVFELGTLFYILAALTLPVREAAPPTSDPAGPRPAGCAPDQSCS